MVAIFICHVVVVGGGSGMVGIIGGRNQKEILFVLSKLVEKREARSDFEI